MKAGESKRGLIFTLFVILFPSGLFAQECAPTTLLYAKLDDKSAEKPAIDYGPGKLPRGFITPPSLGNPGKPIAAFGCQREFHLSETKKPIDSWNKQDAEKLRPYFQRLPAAISELDTYQDTRRKSQISAYIGTAGLVGMILGPIAAELFMKDSTGALTGDGKVFRNVSFISGAFIAGGAFLYTFTLLRANESHLDNAVRIYNEARPDQPMGLQFSTGILF